MKAGILNKIANCHSSLGEQQQAIEYFDQSLRIWKATGEVRGEVETLINIGHAYYWLGEEERALASYNEALPLSTGLNNPRQRVMLLNDVGLVYYELGEHERAIEYFDQSLDLARANHIQVWETNELGHLGSAYSALGDYPKALEYIKQTIDLAQKLGDRLREAQMLQSIGRVYYFQGEYRKSAEYVEQSMPLLKGLNDSPAEISASVARGHHNLGKAYAELGEYEKGIDHLNQALQTWRQRGDRINEASTIHAMARLERNRGNLTTALAENEAALNIAEWMRSKAGSHESRASYLSTVQKYFELKVDILTRLHKLEPSKNYTAAALQTSERARARGLLETLTEAGVDIRQDVASNLLERERSIQQQLSTKAADQARLLGAKSSKDQLAAIGKQLEELSGRYEEVEVEIRAASPRYAGLAPPQPLSLAAIRQQVIDPQSVLLEFFLGEERSYLWAVTADSIENYELPKRAEIEGSARRVYELLTARNRRVSFETAEERRARIAKADADYPEAAAALSRVLLAPVAAQLTDKRLLIVSDGALQYIPFSALPSPSLKGSSSIEPLGVRHEIISLPSASTLALLRREVAGRKPAAKTVAVLADPVFDKDDERVKSALSVRKPAKSSTILAKAETVTNSRGEIERSARESGWGDETLSMVRLPFTRKEADAITALVSVAMRKEALDFAASRANATGAELSQYRIVHFATHGFLNSRHPELSGVVLSLLDQEGREQDGFLRAHEIYNLNLPAELVVLSGCRTGLGKEIRGEGLIGLTRAFMHAGAARVMVSLWDVNDHATAELMSRFYKLMLGSKRLSPAAALREAQASMSREKRWQAPYYWAGFILQGEPR